MLGLPSKVTDTNGTVTSILYDNFGRTTQTTVAYGATVVYNYSNGNLASIARTYNYSSQTYYFSYDAFGNLTNVSIGNASIATYTYGAGNGALLKQTFGNQDTVTFTYDYLGRIKTETLADDRVVTYTYNGEGQLYSVTEVGGDSPAAYYYTYDSNGRLVSSEKRSTAGESLMRVHLYYNDAGQLVGQIWNVGGTEYTEGYTYNDADGTLNTMTTAGQTLQMTYDALRRLSSVGSSLYTKGYTYRDISGAQTTTQVTEVAYTDLPTDISFSYAYYLSGNIASYTAPDNEKITYYYDTQGQLTKAAGDVTYTYTYDSVGNILTANGHTYTYGDTNWKDKLTAFDGQSIDYDNSGNPTSYYNGTRWTFTWENGRSLATASSTGQTLSYAYDASGLRTSKTVNGVVHNYYYAGGKLLRETYGNNVLDFFYDQNGQPFAFKYNGTMYYYITSLQGDVMYVLNSSGTTVASYEYDPYGNIVSATGTMAQINPLRYRGYYYDTDSGFYYLQSRYYDPAIGRFITADVLVSTGQGVQGYNMFAYCNNNPVNNVDPIGCAPSKYFFAVCLGGNGSDPISGQSDGKGESDVLLEYIVSQQPSVPNTTVFVNVEYVGIYTHTTDSLGTFLTILGGVCLLTYVPFVKDTAWLCALCSNVGNVCTACGILSLLASDDLLEKDYHQYKVTMSWTQTTMPYSNVYVLTEYYVEIWFLRDDTSYTNPQWYLQSSDFNEVSSSCVIR